MLWKPEPRPVSKSTSSLSKSQKTSSYTNGNGNNQTGVVIYPFQDYKKEDPSLSPHFLNLDLGDTVVISREVSPGWYYGYRKWEEQKLGLFPSSHIAQPNHEFGAFLQKIGEVCREWGEIRKKLYVEVHPYQFDHIGRGIFELIEGRRAILNQSLTQDQYREVTRRLCSRIDWGNRKLGLDLVPWNWLLEDAEEKETPLKSISSLSEQKSLQDNGLKVLPECNKDAGKLFKLHQKSVESAATRGSSTLSRPKGKKEQRNNLYIGLRDFNYTFTDDCEIAFSLFDGKKFVSERHVILHTQTSPSVFHTGDDRPTIFQEITNKRDLYLVVQIVRIGRMFYAENSSGKNKFAKRRFRRPYACGVLSLNDLEYLNEDEFEFNSGFREKHIKLYNSDEKDFWQVHELIVSQNYRNIVSKIIPVLNSFVVSVFWCGLHNFGGKGGNVQMTRLIGLNNLIAPPGVVRNDLYFTLTSVELVEKKQNKTGGAKSCNLEVEIQVIDDDDELLRVDGNGFKSIILHHVNTPKYNETIKFNIPIEVFPKTKVRCIFRHCSTKDKNEKKMFGICWVNLMDPSGTTLKDGDHTLPIYKWTDEHSLPTPSTNLNLSKDTVYIQTLMVSTKFTQNIDLVNLLKWKQTANLKPSLQNLISSTEATEEIVRKFLQDVLDALFTIFSDDDGNSTDYSGDVFILLVNIFQLLRNNNYAAYKSVLNAYCAEHFAAALVYKGLLQSLRHYTTVLLNSVTEDITQLIQNCYNSLEFIFKFVVQSQILFAKATGGQLEDSFRRDVQGLVKSFCKVFSCTDLFPVFVETQSILLQNLHSVYEELLRVMPLMDVCELVCEIFNAIPIKETAAHPLSPAKLSAIHQTVKSSLFKHENCRAKLLPVMCMHIRHHLAHREELKLCTDVLSEILIYLHDIKENGNGGKEGVGGNNAHADIEVVCTTTLEMLVQSVLVLERTSSIVGNLVTCLISLLEQMDKCHYNRLWNEFLERKPLRDLLLRVFLLFRDLIKHEVFPADWAFMKLLTNHVMMTSLQEFCQPLVNDFLKFFDVQLWSQYFTLAVTFINQPGLQMESFREAKKEWILEKYGDMRLTMAKQMLNLWGFLNDSEKKNFIPSMIGPFLEVSMICQKELRQITLQTFFFDMMKTEFRLNGNIKETESELIDKLDLLINSEEERQHGDEEFRIKFREIHLARLDKDQESKGTKMGDNWYPTCANSIESLSNLQQLLLDYREIAKFNMEENRDKLMQCTVNLLNFYRDEKRLEQYLRYVYKLHDLHLSTENYTEAGFTLLLHGQLLKWDWEKMLPESYEPGLQYPRQREAERKEFIYLRVLGYFDQGKVWEKGITLCKELGDQYEKKYDYNKLSRILQTQATFYDNILNQHRPEPEYFRVGFFGQGFPLFVRNKEFIYRGQEYERLGAFIQRILAEWSSAQLLQKNSPPDGKILTDGGQFLQICNVKPKSGQTGKNLNMALVPEKIKSFYYVNDVCVFQYDRRIEKQTGEMKTPDDGNEFKTMWVERTTLKTAVEFPGTLRMLEIVEKKTVELSPIEFACEKMEEVNSQLQSLMSQYSVDENNSQNGSSELKNVNPLSMRLQGMLDAAVMGGIPKYTEAFFNEEFLKKEESSCFVTKLVGLLTEQTKLLEEGLEIHGKLVPPGVQPLHKRLLECHLQMKSSVQETELLIHSTLASLNNATLRRSESGSNIVVRDSFRKLGSGKSIVNSPLPPVPKYCPGKREEKIIGNSSNSNRSSTSSGGYGQVTINSGRQLRDSRDHFDDDDDDVYSQPVEDHLNNVKPPLIPNRMKKGASVTSVESNSNSNEYIIMPPSRLREIVDGQNNLVQLVGPAPAVPPKPGSGTNNTSVSPPPPLFPRKAPAPVVLHQIPVGTNNTPEVTPGTGMSKTPSTTSLNSTDKPVTPPPVPPKPKGNKVVEEMQNTYMNKAELLASMEDEDNINKNKNEQGIGGERISPSPEVQNRRSGHKEYYVPPGIDNAKDSSNL